MSELITFQEWMMLAEELQGSGPLGIWKNPTKEESSQLKSWVRGFIDVKEQNFYVFNTKKGSIGLHVQGIGRAKKFNKIKDGNFDWATNRILTVHRVGSSNVFALGETEWSAGHGMHTKAKKAAQEIKKKLGWPKFVDKIISDFDDFYSWERSRDDE